MEWLKIATTTEVVRIAMDEIVYILADGNYCDIMMTNGKTHKMTFQLHYFEDHLTNFDNTSFTRVGRRVIVNKKHIRIINVTDRIIRFGGHTVADSVPALRMDKLGKDALKELKNEITHYEDRS